MPFRLPCAGAQSATRTWQTASPLITFPSPSLALTPPQHNVSTGSPAPAPVSDEDLADAIAWATRHTGGVSLRAAALFARFFATAAAAE